MVLPIVLETIVESVHERLKDSFVFVQDEPTQEDLDHILKEAEEDSRFDELRLRPSMLEDYRAGKAKLVCRSGPYAKVLAIVHPQAEREIPWSLWSKIFLAFGPPPRGSQPYRIVWFAHPSPRRFPDSSDVGNSARVNKAVQNRPSIQPGPRHVNGGYAIACLPHTIVIYRKEEASRVLVHELLHATCTDNMDNPEHMREALTETWAELFLTAIQANGSKRKAARLWAIQAQWIADQQAVLESEYGVVGPDSYAWRYTVARGDVLRGLGIDLPAPSANPKQALDGSLAFTAPPLTQA